MDERKDGRMERRKEKGRMDEGPCPHTPFASQTLGIYILRLKRQQVQNMLI